MAWRNVIISKPSRLALRQKGLVIEQEGHSYKVPLEDIATILIDNPQITLTAQLLSHCAEFAVAIISVNDKHLPNGIFLPYLPHSRSLKVMQQQLAMTQPTKKRLWQTIVQQKINNQAAVLKQHSHLSMAIRLQKMSATVRSGDPDNIESQAAGLYFPTLLGRTFHRKQMRFYNSSLNFCYSIIRSAIARCLVIYGLLPAFGLQHHNQLNSFNLADDLIEPLRPFVDLWILALHPDESPDLLEPNQKAQLVDILHQDISQQADGNDLGKITILSHIEQTVISLTRHIANKNIPLTLAVVDSPFHPKSSKI